MEPMAKPGCPILRVPLGILLVVEGGLSAAFFRWPAGRGLGPLLIVALMAALGMVAVRLSDDWLGPQEGGQGQAGWNRAGIGEFDATRDAIIPSCPSPIRLKENP